MPGTFWCRFDIFKVMLERYNLEQDGINKREAKIIDTRSRELQRVILEDARVIELLSKLSSHHHDTYLHSLRVGLLSIDLGYEGQLDESKINALGYAAHLHDIGKSKIDLNILDKKERLDEGERSEIKKHIRRGFVILTNFENEEIKMIVAQHHEYQPGSYPRTDLDRRKEDRDDERRSDNSDIDYLGEIIAVSDMVDALTSSRAYKEPLPIGEVERILRTEFLGDPLLIDRVLKRY